MSILFEPVQIGPYQLPNRIIMAPLSRYRASLDGVPPSYAVDYYSQRASAGLIIAEGTVVNDWGSGMKAPGIFRDDQIAVWKNVTNAVHTKGGKIFLQFWHGGRVAHTSLMPEGRDVAGPSAIPMSSGKLMTPNGMQPATPPRAFSLEEIAELRSDYAQAASNAKTAGFDGIEIQAANGYLVDQFLQDASNQRQDDYGGSAEKRVRFLLEVLEDAIAIWGADRVGVRISPTGAFNDVGDSDTLETFSTVIDKLNGLGLAYLHLIHEMPGTPATPEQVAINDALCKRWNGILLSNGGFDADSGAKHIAAGKASAIVYGRTFIANPDLVERFRTGSKFNDVDEKSIYGGDEHGYSDYPFLNAEVSS